MKKQITLVLIAAGTLLISFRYAADWTKYTSQEGHYSATFPGKVEESSEDDKTDDGTPFKIHYATCSPSDNEVYMVGWINMTSFYPKDKSMTKMLEDSRDGATESMKASDVRTIKMNLESEPYIEFTFKTGDFVGKDKIYIIDKFQYSVITIFDKKDGIKPTAEQFINSFVHLK